MDHKASELQRILSYDQLKQNVAEKIIAFINDLSLFTKFDF